MNLPFALGLVAQLCTTPTTLNDRLELSLQPRSLCIVKITPDSLVMISGEIHSLSVWQRDLANTLHALDVRMPFSKSPSGQTFFTTRPWSKNLYTFENTGDQSIKLKLQRISSATAIKNNDAWKQLESQLQRWKKQLNYAKAPKPWWANRSLQDDLDGLNLLKAAFLQAAISPNDSERLLASAIKRTLDKGRVLRPPWFRKTSDQSFSLKIKSPFAFTTPVRAVVRLGFRALQSELQTCTRIRVVAGSQPEIHLALHCHDISIFDNGKHRLQFPLEAGSSLRVAIESGQQVQITFCTYERLTTLIEALIGEPGLTQGHTDNLATILLRAENARLSDQRRKALSAYENLEQLAPPGSFVAAYAAWQVARLLGPGPQSLNRLILVASFCDTHSHWGRTLAYQALAYSSQIGMGEKGPPWTAIFQSMPQAIQNQLRIIDLDKPEAAMAALLAAKPKSRTRTGRSRRIRRLLQRLNSWQPLEFNPSQTKKFIDPAHFDGSVNQDRRLYRKIPDHGLTLRVSPDPANHQRPARIPLLAQTQNDQAAFVSLQIDGENLSLPLDEPITQTALALSAGVHHIHRTRQAAVYIAAPTDEANLEYRRLRTYFAVKQNETYQAALPEGVRPGVLTFYWHIERAASPSQAPIEFEFCFAEVCRQIRIVPQEQAVSTNDCQHNDPIPLLLPIPNLAKQVSVRRIDHQGNPVYLRAWLRTHQPIQQADDRTLLRLSTTSHVISKRADQLGLFHPQLGLPIDSQERSELRKVITDFRHNKRSSVDKLQSLIAKRGVENTPLASWLLSKQLAQQHKVTDAADVLAKLAASQTAWADFLRVQAARYRLRSKSSCQWLKAYTELAASMKTPGDRTDRRLASQLTYWQSIPHVEQSQGTLVFQAHQDHQAPNKSWSVHLIKPEQDLYVTIMGPTVLRIRVRTDLDLSGDLKILVSEGQRKLSLFTPDLVHDPTVTPRLSGPNKISTASQLQVVLDDPRPHRVRIQALHRLAYVTLAVRTAKDSQTQTIPPRLQAQADRAHQFYQVTLKHLVSVFDNPAFDIKQTAPASLPLSFELQGGFKDRMRDEESHHVANEPYLPFSLDLSRRLGREIWLALGPRLRQRFDAPLTLGLAGRFDFGVGTGPLLSLTFSGYTQSIAGAQMSSLRANVTTGWEFGLLPSLRIRLESVLLSRLLSHKHMPESNQVDPLVYSTYSRDHPLGLRARFNIIYQPTVDLRLRAGALFTSNADVRSLESYRWLATADWLYRGWHAGLGFRHQRYFADQDRFLPYSLNWFSGRVGWGFWLSAGQRLSFEARGRYFVEEARHDAQILVRYQLCLGRSLQDFSPRTHLFRSLLAEDEPGTRGLLE